MRDHLPIELPSPAEAVRPTEIDRRLHAQLAHLTQGFSPAALAGAWGDWISHLAWSPGKQIELVSKASRKVLRLQNHAACSCQQPCDRCIEPLPQDKRFAAPEWDQWPFNVVSQSFLLNQQWWHNATTGVRGVTRHHEDVVTFAARQLLDLVSPSNFLFSNPEVVARTLETGGANLWRGASNWLQDLGLLAAGGAAGTERFRPGHEVAITPGKVIFRNRLIELIQYSARTREVFAAPVLIVPSWILKYYILDLSPENSLVRYLVGQGHTVFMLSWRNPVAADQEIGMDDYLNEGVMAAMTAVSAIVPRTQVQAVGYCLGGTLLSIAAAAMARDGDRRLGSLTLLASQVDFTEPGELALFIDESQIAYLEDVMSEQGYLDGRRMAGTFTLLNSRDLVFSRMVREYLMGERQQPNDLTAWNADVTRMPLRQHSEYLRSLYLHNDLAQGRYRVGGRPVALSDIHVPIFCVGTERDSVSPWRSVFKISLLTASDVSFCLTTGGHNVGVVNPPASGVKRSYRLGVRPAEGLYVDPDTWYASTASEQGSWWPAWAQWLAGRAAKRVAAPRKTARAKAYPVLDDAPGKYVLMT